MFAQEAAQRRPDVGAELQVVVDLLEARRREAADRAARLPADGGVSQAAAELAEIDQELGAARRCLRISAGGDPAQVRTALAGGGGDGGRNSAPGPGGERSGKPGDGGASPRVALVPPSPSWTFPRRGRGSHGPHRSGGGGGPAWVRRGGESFMHSPSPAHSSPGGRPVGADRYLSDSGGRARRSSAGGAGPPRRDSFRWGASPSPPSDKRRHAVGVQRPPEHGSSVDNGYMARGGSMDALGGSVPGAPGWPLVPSAEVSMRSIRPEKRSQCALRGMRCSCVRARVPRTWRGAQDALRCRAAPGRWFLSGCPHCSLLLHCLVPFPRPPSRVHPLPPAAAGRSISSLGCGQTQRWRCRRWRRVSCYAAVPCLSRPKRTPSVHPAAAALHPWSHTQGTRQRPFTCRPQPRRCTCRRRARPFRAGSRPRLAP